MAKRNKSLLRYALVPIALLLELSLIPGWLTPGQAVTFKPPGDQAPTQSTGGASRDGGQCFSNATKTSASVTPLMPNTNHGLTLAERPTLFVHVPQTTAKEAFFSLQDEQSNEHYQTTLLLPDKPGVIGVKVPDDAPALQTGKNYKWSLVIVCDEELEPDSPGVSGWIRRVEPNPSLVNQTKLAASLESTSKLAEAGIWYDALSTLAQLRRSQPENQTLTKDWQELLKSVGLDAIATEPLIEN